ncbi:MAG: hypothetical protein R3Y08_02090 [Rikenellaceae bacterium]
MKSIYKLLSAALLILCVVSCEEEREFDDLNHSMVMTSFGGQSNIMQVNGWMSFIDLSRGVVSREWSFPSGDVVIDEDGAGISTSSEEVVKVSFVEPGTYYVNIKQQFAGSSYYLDSDFVDGSTYEEDIEVVVRDSVRASYTAYYDTKGVALTVSDDAMNQVEAGHSVTFTSTSTGVPSSIKWVLTRDDGFSADLTGDTTTSTGTYKFSVPGIYHIGMIVSSDFGNSSISNKNVIEVVASSDPVILDGVERASTNEIGLVFSRAMNDASTCDLSAFTVSIINSDEAIPCNVVSLSTLDNIVKIMLDTDIYSSDELYVSYDAAIGDLSTVDYVMAESFTDAQLTEFNLVDILGNAGFDTSFENSSASDWAYLWWGSPWDMYTMSISSDVAYSGEKSSHLNMQAYGGAIIEWRSGGSTEIYFDAVANTKYQVGFWAYVTTMTYSTDFPEGAFAPDIRANLSTDNTWGYAASFGDDTPLNEWVYRTVVVSTSTTGSTKLQFRGCNNSLPGEFDFYFDDLTVVEYEERK